MSYIQRFTRSCKLVSFNDFVRRHFVSARSDRYLPALRRRASLSIDTVGADRYREKLLLG